MASYGRRISAFRTIFDHPPNHSAASCVSVRIMLLCSRALTKATFCQTIFLLMLLNKCIKKHNIVACLFVFEQGRDGCVDCAPWFVQFVGRVEDNRRQMWPHQGGQHLLQAPTTGQHLLQAPSTGAPPINKVTNLLYLGNLRNCQVLQDCLKTQKLLGDHPYCDEDGCRHTKCLFFWRSNMMVARM